MGAQNNKKKRKSYKIIRNWIAVSAHFATGGGIHKDRRFKRNRTRALQKQNSISEYL